MHKMKSLLHVILNLCSRILFQISQTSGNNGLSNSFVATSVSAQPSGFSPQQNLVYTTISVRIFVDRNTVCYSGEKH